MPNVASVEVLTRAACEDLIRMARHERRKWSDALLHADPKTLLSRDLSSVGEMAFDVNRVEELPSFLRCEQEPLGEYEDADAVALVVFAREHTGKPVLVEFAGPTSKAFVDRLRWSAKTRGFRAHFYRLFDDHAIFELEPRPDSEEIARFLRTLDRSL